MTWLENIFDPSEISGWDAVFAVLVLIAGFVLAHFAKKAVLALAVRAPGLPPGMVSLAARLTKYGVILLAIGIALAVLGANIQPLLAGVIIIVAVGVLALRGVAANFGSAVIIQARRSIHLGQEIEVLDFVGTVTELNARAVVIQTRDGRSVHIPNSEVLSNPMINNSELGGRRSSVEVRVVVSRPTEEIIGAIQRAAESVVGGFHLQPVSILTRSLSPERATYEVRVWHPPLRDPEVTSQVVAAIHSALSALGVHSTVSSPVPVPPLVPPPAL